ncbi:MAG: response regulator transcription factor [Anaerolineales bacterium]|nr:response regulator transcription factor [Anaerolineales bacterium]
MDRTILVIEDDRKTVDLIRLYLERDEYRVVEAFDGRMGLEMARRVHPDLVILDLMLPRLDGLEVCRLLRNETNTPIIMLTARATEDDKLIGLDLGADDYVTKPFSPRELMARVRAVLRRATEQRRQKADAFTAGDLRVDFVRQKVTLQGETIHLTRREFRLLEILTNEPGRVFSRLDLLEDAFGFDYGGLERTVDVHIMNLRKKIEPDPEHPRYIQTIYGAGYCFAEASHAA